MVQCGMAGDGYGIVWQGMGMVWYGLVCGTACFGTVWYGRVPVSSGMFSGMRYGIFCMVFVWYSSGMWYGILLVCGTEFFVYGTVWSDIPEGWE